MLQTSTTHTQHRAAVASGLELKDLISRREAHLGIIGLGYVGMPLARAGWKAGFKVLGFDTDDKKIRKINAGESYSTLR